MAMGNVSRGKHARVLRIAQANRAVEMVNVSKMKIAGLVQKIARRRSAVVTGFVNKTKTV